MTTTARTCTTSRQALVGPVTRRAAAIRLGDPFAEDAGSAPMGGTRRPVIVLGIVDPARAEGARAVAGGRRAPLGGLGAQPIMLTDVRDPAA
jgi:acyl-CoA reductase-like NAD-dependent aldehyde dehydrogenase